MSAVDEAASQAERTALAWSRTLLATAALVAFLAVVVHRAGMPRVLVVSLAMAAVLLFLATSVVPRRVWNRSRAALSGTTMAARPLPTLVLAGSVAALAPIALLVSLAGGDR